MLKAFAVNASNMRGTANNSISDDLKVGLRRGEHVDKSVLYARHCAESVSFPRARLLK